MVRYSDENLYNCAFLQGPWTPMAISEGGRSYQEPGLRHESFRTRIARDLNVSKSRQLCAPQS
jgi:hypothetical protein